MKFSVIVPVYNTEEYLSECVSGVLQQPWTDLELLLVDDGSSDGSGALCDAWAAKDERVRVIHQQNGGLCAARNRGLTEARGDYVLFLDADDLWLPDLLNTAEQLTRDEPEMFVFGAERFWENGETASVAVPCLPKGQSGMAYLDELFACGTVPLPFVWLYGYRRRFLLDNGLVFRVELNSSEDFDYNMRALVLADRIVGSGEVLYRYRVRSNSLSMSLNERKLLSNLQNKQEWYRRFPCGAMADLYTYNASLVFWLGKRERAEAAVEHVRRHRDILRRARAKKMRLAAGLMTLFGIWGGSGLYWRLWKLCSGKDQRPW